MMAFYWEIVLPYTNLPHTTPESRRIKCGPILFEEETLDRVIRFLRGEQHSQHGKIADELEKANVELHRELDRCRANEWASINVQKEGAAEVEQSWQLTPSYVAATIEKVQIAKKEWAEINVRFEPRTYIPSDNFS